MRNSEFLEVEAGWAAGNGVDVDSLVRAEHGRIVHRHATTTLGANFIVATALLIEVMEVGPEIPRPTLSMGVSACIPVSGVGYDCLLRQADRALYMAKQNGRDQVQSQSPGKFCD